MRFSFGPGRTLLQGLALATLMAALTLARQQPGEAAGTADVTIQSFAYNPSPLEVVVGTTVTWHNNDGTNHTVTEDTRLWDSRNIGQFKSFSYTFNQSGTYNYGCTIHGFMHGTVVVTPPPLPVLQQPIDGSELPSFGTRLQWANIAGAQQVQLQVIPAFNDGPGVNVVLGPVTAFDIPAPPRWYGLLPNMTYTWRVRSSDAQVAIPDDHPSWSGWSQASFHTPHVDASTITPVSPPQGSIAPSRTPTLVWSNSRSDIFYYEVQLSKDPSFNTDPATAIGPVYGALIHGGVSNPPNSYAVPANAPLEPNTAYYWRVRPRVQGDGTPILFPAAFSFRTP